MGMRIEGEYGDWRDRIHHDRVMIRKMTKRPFLVPIFLEFLLCPIFSFTQAQLSELRFPTMTSMASLIIPRRKLTTRPFNVHTRAFSQLSSAGEKAAQQRIEKILIANRGEIACRIMRTAKRLGIRTVAVYSDADKDSLHVQSADEAIRIGPPPARFSYLNASSIVDAAIRSGAQVSPGTVSLFIGH